MTDPTHLALAIVTIFADLEDTDPAERKIIEAARKQAKSTDKEDNTE